MALTNLTNGHTPHEPAAQRYPTAPDRPQIQTVTEKRPVRRGVSRAKLWAAIEKGYAVLTLLTMSRPMSQVLQTEKVDLLFVAVVALYLVVVPIIFGKINRFLWVMARDKLLLLLLALAILSAVWSVDPASTLRSTIVLFGATFFGVYLAFRFQLRDQMCIWAWMLGIAAVLSIIVAIVYPAIGRHTQNGGWGAWSGIYDRKNGLGRYMAIATILFWLLGRASRRKLAGWIGVSVTVALILLSESATPIVALAVTIGLIPLFRQLAARHGHGFLFAGITIAAVLCIGLFLTALVDTSSAVDWFFRLLGRDPNRNTLLLRLGLWQALARQVARRPLVGHGFGNAWSSSSGFTYSWYGFEWHPEQAHNGYLEVALQLGVLGLATMLLHLMRSFRRGVRLVHATGGFEGLWLLSYLVMMSLFNVTYSALLGQLTLPWTIYVATTVASDLRLRTRETNRRRSPSMAPPRRQTQR